MTRPFLKMNGLGNDFVVVETRSAPFAPTPDEVRAIADEELRNALTRMAAGLEARDSG